MRIAAAAAHSCRNEKQLDENPTTAGFNSKRSPRTCLCRAGRRKAC